MTKIQNKEYDVIVVGGGNAGLCAALSARENGASVLLIEKASEENRGGNTKFCSFFRFTYDGLEDIMKLVPDLTEEERQQAVIEPYTKDKFYNDMMRVTRGRVNPEMLEVVVNNSRPIVEWLIKQGVEHQLNYKEFKRYKNKLYFQPGACLMPKRDGSGMVDSLCAACANKGVEVVYETTAMKLLQNRDARISGVLVKNKEGLQEIRAHKAVILASGGFQSSAEMRAKYMGPGWDVMKVRGTRYDTGEGLKMAMEVGAKTTGEWTGAHATQVDAGGPNYEMGDWAFRGSYQCCIIVNCEGKRFLDEGVDFPLYTYAKWGREILRQPNAWACQIFNAAQATPSYLAPMYKVGTRIEANSLEELADILEINRDNLIKTVKEFNNTCQDTEFNPGILDGKKTIGIDPPKSNWAIKLDSPPFVAFPVTAGITFTFGGLETNKYSQVLDTSEMVIDGLYAVGEIQGFFYHNYAGATGLTRGSVFGWIAGAHAMGKKLV